MKKDKMYEYYDLEGRLVPIFDIPVPCLDDDSYYGSDFVRMAAILQETEKYKPGMADISCSWSRVKDGSQSTTNIRTELSNNLDDGYSWAEGPLQHSKLSQITICYALHALCTHMNWSIPDILRIKKFSIEIEMKLTVQHFSD